MSAVADRTKGEMPAPPRGPRAANLGWGLHRLGRLAARRPWIGLAIVLLISAAAAYGVTRAETNTSLDALFKSETPEYIRYEEMREAFPLNERDVLVIVTSPKAFSPDEIAALRDLHLELELVSESEGVLSLFSIRGDPDAEGYAAPIVPDELPRGAAFAEMMQSVAAHPFVADKLLRTTPSGGQALVIIVGLKAEATERKQLAASIKSVDEATKGMLAESGLNYELLGVPVMQSVVHQASSSDRLVFNVSGFIVGLFMCVAFFRHAKLVLIAALCPAATVFWSFGIFGLFGFEITFLMNAVPPLIMVISFAEAMHLTYGVRRSLRDGKTLPDAIRGVVDTVGPACVLTTTTTTAAFLSLLISQSDVIRDFGLAGAMCIVSIFIASMLVVPSLCALLLTGNEGDSDSKFARWATDIGVDAACERLADWIPRRPLLIAGIGIAVSVLCAGMYFSLGPRFRLSEQVPGDLRARIEATEKLVGLAASSPLFAVVRHPPAEPVTSERLQRVLGGVHDTLAKEETVGNVWSLALIERQFAEKSEAELSSYIADLPENFRSRLMNEGTGALLVTGHFPDLDATQMANAIGKIERNLAPLRAENPDLSIELTGISAVAAIHATTMIEDLYNNLMLEIFVVMAILAVAFRSLVVPATAFLPNVLPVIASGALLYLLDFGIDYAGIIGLTVAFGLAVDDTIHFLTRFQHERSVGLTLLQAVKAAISHVGPVMVITTVVIMCGVGVTVLGQMPQTRIFGAVVIVTLFSALGAEMLLTPALILAPQALKRLRQTRFFGKERSCEAAEQGDRH
jgi:predicted RND superfamily exporter protein